MDNIRALASLFRDAFQGFFEDDSPRLAAALAFYTLLSAAPLLIVAVGVAGLVFTQEAIRQDMLDTVSTLIGPSAREVMATLFDNAYDAYRPTSGILASLVGGALLLIGASGVFTQLNASVAKIWGSEHRVRGSIKVAVTERLRGIGMVIAVGLMLIAMLSATTAITNFQRFLVRSTELSELGLEILNLGANVFVVAAFFAFLYRALPGTDAKWREVWPGALVAAPLFAAANYGLGLYLGRNALGSAYGAAGSLVVLLLWVYFIAMVLFFGAEVSSVYAQRRRSRTGEPPPGPSEAVEERIPVEPDEPA